MTPKDRRPYIGRVRPYTWTPKTGDDPVPGLLLGGAAGIAAHLTKTEAYELANQIVDAADKLPEPRAPKPCYASRNDGLTAADGTPEEPLPATPAE